MNSKLRTGALLAIVPFILATLAACTPTVALAPAADATNPGCAEIIVRLPDAVANQPIRETNAQATGAWGNPTSVLLRCGVTPPGATTATCYTVKGVDWLIDDSKKPRYVFTTFGRDPATEVIVDSNLTDGQGTIVLDELANAIGTIKQTKECLTREDVLGSASGVTPTATPTPSPSPSK
ncbi:MAG: hypothetical protein JWO18_1372 [Microbacteriaceae bacterium]|nr:hypothetical protein [Microbacteriaceae bacterium]